jgi:hypothetical protein
MSTVLNQDMRRHGQPSSIVDQPSTVVNQLSTVVDQPSSVLDHPSTVVNQLSTVVDQPSTVVNDDPPRHAQEPPDQPGGQAIARPPSTWQCR